MEENIELKEYPEEKHEEVKKSLKCPECGNETLMIAGRCATCMSCGFSLCSM